MDNKPPLGVKPTWLCAVERIADLASAIQRYATEEHGKARRMQMRLWAEEIVMQIDIWDRTTWRTEELLESETPSYQRTQPQTYDPAPYWTNPSWKAPPVTCTTAESEGE